MVKSISKSPVIDALENKEKERSVNNLELDVNDHELDVHAHGSFPFEVLKGLESILPEKMENTAETGCGRSTILFSNISKKHTAFCIDDHDYQDSSSVLYFKNSELAVKENVTWQFGPTQQTLPMYQHREKYDCVLLDGPHGYPFPDMEYYFFYPHIKIGGYLIIDDIQIPTIGRMADILQEDAMWEFVSLVATTAVFRRTSETQTPTNGDHWWTQNYNRRRINNGMEFYLGDNGKLESFASRNAKNETQKKILFPLRVINKIRRLLG